MNTILIAAYILFATVVYGIYLLLPKKARPFCLLAFSFLFYIVYSKFMTIFLVLTIVTVYLGGIGINKLNAKFDKQKEGLEKDERKALKKKFARKKRWILIGAIVFNFAILAVLKYFNFFTSLFEGFLSWFNVSASMPVLKLALPLGISYYTLSAIGYLIDVNRGKCTGGGFWQVALFVSFFPQLFEGPFASYTELSPQLQAGTGFDKDNFFGGVFKMLWGWIKKVVIADRLAIIVGEVFSNYTQYNGLIIVIGIVLFTFQLYAEFSGLIDIAQGTSNLFGIKLAKNFEQPFFSQSVPEFWRRWHISLGNWMKEYIFYPISMSKGMMKLNKKMSGKVNTFWQVFIPSAIALLAVWLFCGIWHGAGVKYIVYGLYYYFIMIGGMCIAPLSNLLYKKTGINKDNKFLKICRIALTFILVNFGMLLFRANTLPAAFDMFGAIFTGGQLDLIGLGVIEVADVVMCALGVCALIVVDILKEKKIDIKAGFLSQKNYLKTIILVGMIAFVIIFGAFGDGYIPPDPIYGNF